MLHTLTDSKIKAFPAPATKTVKLFDGGGLYLELTAKGGRYWRYKYRVQDTEKRISLGVYPQVGLKQARELHMQARLAVTAGVDPSAQRKVSAAKGMLSSPAAPSNSFEEICNEWIQIKLRPQVGDGHFTRVVSRLEADIYPWLGHLAMDAIDGPMILRALRKIEERGAIETAHRVLQSICQVFRYAIAIGRAKANPANDLSYALRPFTNRHMSSITEPARVGQLLRSIDAYQGSMWVRAALQLGALTFVRPSELRLALWEEFDLEQGVWCIPASRMKGRIAAKNSGNEHLVPLALQSIAVLKELQKYTGNKPMLFPSERGQNRFMSDMTVNCALKTLGYSSDEITPHGFRAMARTMIVERLDIAENIVEAQLAHKVKDTLGRAYNRTTFVEQRKKMMQTWADYLDKLKAAKI